MINDLDIVQWDYLLSPEFEMINSAGKPLTGGYIEVYIHGTRNKYYCASDFNGTLHPFQIPLDSIGSNVILASPENAYDVYVYNKFGSLIMSRYNVHCQGGNGGPSTYVGDKLFYGQYRASNVTTIANLRRNKGNINLTSNGYLKLKNGMSYHITVRGAFQVDDVTNTETTLNYIEYTSVNPIKIDIDETKEDPQYFELSYDIYRLPDDMDYQVAFAQANGMVTELLVEVHSLSNLATSSAGGDQEYEPGWGIDITNNVISVDPSILEDYVTEEELLEIVTGITGIIPEDVATHTEVYEATVTAIEYVTGMIPDVSDFTTHTEVYESIVTAIDFVTGAMPAGQVQSDWDQSDDTQPDYIKNKPELDIYATHDEVNTVSSQIIETVNNVSGILHGEIENIPERQQADWDQNDDTQVDYIKNKPDLSIYATHDEVTDAVTSIDLSEYATHTEVHDSSVTAIQLVTGLIPDVSDFTTNNDVHESIVTAIEYVTGIIPDAQVQSNWTETDTTDPSYIQNKPDLSVYTTVEDVISIVSGVTGLTEYGQFYATNISGAATMARTKGTIDVTNDGKIKLKKGSSYHVTVRGRYNQTTAANTYSNISYIEYITGQSINVNVDKTITESQYFELSYDLYKLNNDSNYYVFFSMSGGTVNDLFIEIHSLDGIGGAGTGPVTGGTEYDAGWGIQILNNVISVNPAIIPDISDFTTHDDVYESIVTAIEYVTGAMPVDQVQSDWTESDTSDPSYIQNKPNQTELIAGDNIGIFDNGSTLTIAASGTDLTGYATELEVNNAIVTATNYVTGLIPDVSDMATKTWVNNQGFLTSIPSTYATKSELSDVEATIPTVQLNSNDQVTAINNHEIAGTGVATYTAGDGIDITNDVISLDQPYDIVAGNNIEITVTGVSAIISAQGGGGGTTYTAGQYISIDSNDVISVTGVAAATAIPTLPDTEEVTFEELDLSDYALASAIPDTSNMISYTGNTAINHIEIVAALPGSPDANTLYLIPEA